MHGRTIEGHETLYEYDGPLVFVAMLDGRLRIFTAVDETAGLRTFVAATATEEAVSAVREGRLSLLGALTAAEELHTVDIDSFMAATPLVSVRLSDLAGRLPKPGSGVSYTFGECPDAMPPAAASL